MYLYQETKKHNPKLNKLPVERYILMTLVSIVGIFACNRLVVK